MKNHHILFNKVTIKLWRFSKKLIYGACLIHCFCEYGGEIVVCSGPSMEPTLHSDDVVFAKSIRCSELSNLERGDIILAKSPHHPGAIICKRIVGLPGDKIPHKGFSSIEVPTGYVWLEGDNASNSTDSRSYGPVPQGLITRKAVLRIYPSYIVFTHNENKFR